MLSNLKNILLTATAFLSSNRVPPNTPLRDYKRLKCLNHMESKKFYIVITSVFILAFFYFTSVGVLFFLPHNAPEFVSGFVTLFSKTIEILAVVIASYVGAQTVVDLKYASKSNTSIEGSTYTENTQDITFIQTNIKEDDYELN